MKSVIEFLDKLPYAVKFILCLPVLDGLCWGIYRICKEKYFFGAIWILLGFTLVGPIVDVFTLITEKKVSVWVE